jgi:hypothetical protein
MFIKKAPNSHGWVNPRDVEELWKDQFDYFCMINALQKFSSRPSANVSIDREYDDFIYPVTVHPDVCGHPHGLLMLERLVIPPDSSRHSLN